MKTTPESPFTETDLETAAIFLVDEYADYSREETADMIYAMQRVIPDDVITRFEGIVRVEEMLQWEKGDLTNLIWENVKANGLKDKAGKPYRFQDACYFVSVRFLNRARSYNTVKAWALTARKYSPEERERLHFQDVPFAHFAYAGKNKFDGREAPARDEILEWSYEQTQAQSYNVSVSQLEEKFEGKVRPQPGSLLAEMPAVDSIENELMNALQTLINLVGKLEGGRYEKISPLIQQGLELVRIALSQIAGEENE